MKSYAQKIREIEENQKIFAREGFTLPLIDLVIRKAWLDVWDSYHLFCHAKEIPNHGTYLEIGTWRGGSVLCAFLATQLSKTSISFITIDRKSDEVLFEATRPISDVRLIRFPSDLAKDKILDNSIDLLFIDGAHHYEQVKRDMLNYWPKIKVGGILLGHDYSRQKLHRGVVKAAREIFGKKLIRLENSRVFKIEKITKEL